MNYFKRSCIWWLDFEKASESSELITAPRKRVGKSSELVGKRFGTDWEDIGIRFGTGWETSEKGSELVGKNS